MKYLLLIWVYQGGIITIEYPSKAECERAKVEVTVPVKDMGFSSHRTLSARCIQKPGDSP